MNRIFWVVDIGLEAMFQYQCLPVSMIIRTGSFKIGRFVV